MVALTNTNSIEVTVIHLSTNDHAAILETTMAGTRAALFEDSWSMDPAELDFSEFRNRHIWGPPDSSGSRPCINMALVRKPFPYSVEQRINPYPNGEDADYGTWDKALDVGRSYLVGATVSMFVSSAISLIENGLSKFSFSQMTAFTIPSLNKTLVLELSRCEFLSRKENLLLLGSSGTGKTHIALALGLSACQRGHRQV